MVNELVQHATLVTGSIKTGASGCFLRAIPAMYYYLNHAFGQKSTEENLPTVPSFLDNYVQLTHHYYHDEIAVTPFAAVYV